MKTQTHPQEAPRDNLQALYQAFQSDCLPPAWLLVGPPGIGKVAFAYQLAQKILCHSSSDAQKSLIQHQMDSGYYPNFFMLKKQAGDSELGIEDVRRLIHYLRQSAPLPGWRVVIVEGIDVLNRYAANALLKTLEEPPAQTLILATAVTAARVLPTLRSRCVRLVFSMPTLLSEGEDFLATLAQSREGTLQDLVSLGGLDFYESIGKALGMAARGDFRSLLPFIEKTAQEELSFVVAVELLEQFLYRLIIHSILPNSQQSTPREENIFKMLLQDISIDHWLTVQQALGQFLHEARVTHLDKKHMLMACFIIIENPEGIHA
jgi:DNA polymerase-3 subunit delta'